MNPLRIIDPTSLALAAGAVLAPSRVAPPKRVTGTFLRGPIPWAWLTAAGRLPGRALQLATYVWFKAGCANSMEVSISLAAVAKEFACDRSTMSRALSAMIRAGLVLAQHRDGRKVQVTILLDSEKH